MTARTPSVWVVGSTMVDLITYGSRSPAAGETVVGDRFAIGCGGKGANQAVMSARLGAAVTMVNAVGDDAFGTMMIENFEAEGIDVRHVVRIDGEHTGAAPIFVEPDGTNRIIVIPGANARMDPAGAAAAVDAAPSVDVVVGQLEIPQAVTAAAFGAARARGALTILNPAPAAAIDQAVLGATDWLVFNEVEVAHVAATLGLSDGDPADPAWIATVQGATRAGIVVTLGAAGALAMGPDGDLVRTHATLVDAIDTTGAGDAFVGAFAVLLARGSGLGSAMAAACALASDSVQRPGTQRSFPDPESAARIVATSRDSGDRDHLPH